MESHPLFSLEEVIDPHWADEVSNTREVLLGGRIEGDSDGDGGVPATIHTIYFPNSRVEGNFQYLPIAKYVTLPDELFDEYAGDRERGALLFFSARVTPDQAVHVDSLSPPQVPEEECIAIALPDVSDELLGSSIKSLGREFPDDLAASDSALLEAVARALLRDDTAEPNLVVICGAVGEPPLPIRTGSRAPALHLTIDHRVPGWTTPERLASTSVEVPGELLSSYPRKIEMGDRVLVLGRAAGAGEVLATAVFPARAASPEDSPEAGL